VSQRGFVIFAGPSQVKKQFSPLILPVGYACREQEGNPMEDPKKQNDAGAPTHIEQTEGLSVEGRPLSEDDLRTVSGGLNLTDGGSESSICIF
jgi:hypothetical protein